MPLNQTPKRLSLRGSHGAAERCRPAQKGCKATSIKSEAKLSRAGSYLTNRTSSLENGPLKSYRTALPRDVRSANLLRNCHYSWSEARREERGARAAAPGGKTTPQVTGDPADTPAAPTAILYGADRIAIYKGDVRERVAPAATRPPSSRGARRNGASLPKAPEGRGNGSAFTAPPSLKRSRALPGREGTRTPAGHGRGGGRRSLPGAAAAAAAARAPAASAAGPPCPPRTPLRSAPLPRDAPPAGRRSLARNRGPSAGVLRGTAGWRERRCSSSRSPATPSWRSPALRPALGLECGSAAGREGGAAAGGRGQQRHSHPRPPAPHARSSARPPAPPPAAPPARPRGTANSALATGAVAHPKPRAPPDTASPAASRPPRRGADGDPRGSAGTGGQLGIGSEQQALHCLSESPSQSLWACCARTALVCALTHILQPGIPIEKKHMAVEFSELPYVLCLLRTLISFTWIRSMELFLCLVQP
nr:translation initiation factor IF-2-like [Taeniopygia guttata]